MKLAESDRVDYSTAKSLALAYLATLDRRDLTKASAVGWVIWPGSKLRAQGLGGAASRILKRMQVEGLAEWISSEQDWGWRITAKGRSAI